MRILEYNEDDFRELFDEEYNKLNYQIDKMQIKTLTDFLGYEIKTDGRLVYAVNGNDIIEIGFIGDK